MKVLIIGGGGREHAIAWRLARSPSVTKLYAAPGNPGIALVAQCLTPRSQTPEGFLEIAQSVEADLTVVGPEAPLVAGVVNLFRSRGRLILGPCAEAAQLEGSKIFAKRAMRQFGVPTARFVAVHSETEAQKALGDFGFPVVLKADGLAAGKGVIIARDRAEANAAVTGLLSGRLVGEAGAKLVIEEFLTGEEVSFIVLSDGTNVLPLEPAQDHKAVFDGDAGPNTGGMGAYCDSHILNASQMWQILDATVLPVIENMRKQGNPFVGFLYVGLMMTPAGPRVLEYNVRLGDPETQPLMYRMKGDLAPLLVAAARGDLKGVWLDWHSAPSACVVLAAEGYPGEARKGDLIHGIEEAEALGTAVFQGGTKAGSAGLETAGGRVLGVTASGRTLSAAIEHTYAAVSKIHFDGMHFRKDIGRKGLKRW